MNAQATIDGQVLENVVLMDIRSATEEAIAGIKRIENVVTLIHSPETAHFITRLSIENLVHTVETTPDARIITELETIGADFFSSLTQPIDLVVTGTIFMESDVKAEDIEQKLAGLDITGQIFCPKHLLGPIQAKTRSNYGQIQPISEGAKFVMGPLKLTEAYLNSLPENTEVVVIGVINAEALLPNDLLAQKIKRIITFGHITCREENVTILTERLDTTLSGARTRIIPAGFEVVNRQLVLNEHTLTSLSQAKLYCRKAVRIADNVNAELLDQAIDTIIVDNIACPAALKSVMVTKFDPLKTRRMIFYEGDLWLIEDESTLLAPRFDFLAGKATLIVTGSLTIADDIDPHVLADRLDKVHNFGRIRANVTQIAAMQARLGASEGEFIDVTAQPAEDDDDALVLENAVYLKL